MAYQSLTLATLRSRLKARYESVVFWTDTEANEAINEGLLTWGMLTGRWKTQLTLETTADTYELVLPSPFVYGMQLSFDDQPLSPTSRFDLDQGRPRWRVETTADGGAIPSVPTLWAPVSLQLVYIWPMDAEGHHTWTVDGVLTTPQLTADGDYVNLPEADVSLLLGFALHVLTLKKGSVWFEATLPYFQEFIQAAALENSLITTSQWYRRYMGLTARDLKPLLGQPASVSALVPGQGGQ